MAFKLFDSDGDGFITLDDLKRVMRATGEKMTDSELRDMFRKADQDRDNLVSFSGKCLDREMRDNRRRKRWRIRKKRSKN